MLYNNNFPVAVTKVKEVEFFLCAKGFYLCNNPLVGSQKEKLPEHLKTYFGLVARFLLDPLMVALFL